MVLYRIVGYDRTTERLAVSFDIPAQLVADVMKVADVPKTDPYAVGAYPPEVGQVRDIAGIIRRRIPAHEYEYFLEPFAVEAAGKRPTERRAS